MAQYLKDEIQDRISTAALELFARKGFESATMAEIARAAHISTGNIYRYYENKEVLFQSVVPDDFVTELVRLLRRKVKALDRVEDYRTLPSTAPFQVISEEALAFFIAHRLRMVILLGNARGTRYEGFAEELARSLSRAAVSHFRELDPALEVTVSMRFALALIYRNLVRSLVVVLTELDDEAEIRAAVAAYSKYHLAGMQGLFAG